MDTSNSGSSGAGWAPGEDGLPSLPITTVAGVLSVGVVILELIAHAPVLSLILPRVLQVKGLQAAGSRLMPSWMGTHWPCFAGISVCFAWGCGGVAQHPATSIGRLS